MLSLYVPSREYDAASRESNRTWRCGDCKFFLSCVYTHTLTHTHTKGQVKKETIETNLSTGIWVIIDIKHRY